MQSINMGMKDNNVTPIRDDKGLFVKGVSGNPHGVSVKHAAIKQMQRENEVLLTTMITEMVPHAAKLHKALLRDKGLTTKEALELIHLTYRYGIGTPRQADAAPKKEVESTVDDYSPEMLDEIEKLIAETRKGAQPE